LLHPPSLTSPLPLPLVFPRLPYLQIRGSIKALFPDRDCFTLVRPMHDERALNRLNQLQPEQLRPEFQGVSDVRPVTSAPAFDQRLAVLLLL
jgi:hypothetical protein